jgi:hypothetical protein
LGLLVFLLATGAVVFVLGLVIDLAGTGVVRHALTAHSRRWDPPHLTVPQLGLVVSMLATPPWRFGVAPDRRVLVEHAAWGAVVDLVDRGILSTGPRPGDLLLPPSGPVESQPGRPAPAWSPPTHLRPWDRQLVGLAALGSADFVHTRAPRLVERYAEDDRLWNDVLQEVGAAGYVAPLTRVPLRLAALGLLSVVALVVVYWQLVAGVGADAPWWVKWPLVLLLPALSYPLGTAVGIVNKVLELHPSSRLLRRVRRGIGYDYPAEPGLVVAVDGVRALTRTHPELAHRLGLT